MRSQSILLIVVLFVTSCTSGDKDIVVSTNKLTEMELAQRENLILYPLQYVNWVHEPSNKLLYSKTIGNVTYELLCKPVDYIISQETKGQEIELAEYERLKAELGSIDYYDFRISINGYTDEFLRYDLNDLTQYQNRIDYCAFRMENDLKMFDGIDSISCALFHFERTFNLAPYGKFLIGFQKSTSNSSFKTLVFHDGLFSNGTIKIVIDPEVLNHLPKLKTL